MVRRLSQRIYLALRVAINCNCSLHDLGLDIVPKKVNIISGDEDKAARSLQFDIVFGAYGQQQTKLWNRVRIRLAEEGLQSQPSKPLPPTRSSLKPWPKSPRKAHRARSAPFFTRTKSNKDPVAIPMEIQNSPQPSLLIKNLCQLLCKGKGTTSDCYGYITDMSNKFNLYNTQDS